jgi:hypothetical protein
VIRLGERFATYSLCDFYKFVISVLLAISNPAPLRPHATNDISILGTLLGLLICFTKITTAQFISVMSETSVPMDLADLRPFKASVARIPPKAEE